jgi:hypothetical protein
LIKNQEKIVNLKHPIYGLFYATHLKGQEKINKFNEMYNIDELFGCANLYYLARDKIFAKDCKGSLEYLKKLKPKIESLSF